MKEIRFAPLLALDFDDIKSIYSLRGISIYKNVIVLWDEDFDTRVLAMLDNMSEWDRHRLLAVHEHEGTMQLFWHMGVPPGYEDEIDTADDIWSIDNHVLETAK